MAERFLPDAFNRRVHVSWGSAKEPKIGVRLLKNTAWRFLCFDLWRCYVAFRIYNMKHYELNGRLKRSV